MQKVIYLLVLTGILLSACSKSIDQTPISCKVDNGVDSCQEGFTCYQSQSCHRGLECGPQEGDALCHKNCETNSDCPDNMPNCQDVDISRGDIVLVKKFCVN